MAAPDISQDGLGGPAVQAFVIAPNDGQDLPYLTRAIYVGGAGNLAVVLKNQQAGVQGNAAETVVVFNGVLAGSILAIRAGKVKLTGTSATLLLGLI